MRIIILFMQISILISMVVSSSKRWHTQFNTPTHPRYLRNRLSNRYKLADKIYWDIITQELASIRKPRFGKRTIDQQEDEDFHYDNF
uniref:Uncharacterized protein n=1 Tax=Romanomermis culicivorax TaxID=13658 RepID=A0A915HIR7_ROMCU